MGALREKLSGQLVDPAAGPVQERGWGDWERRGGSRLDYRLLRRPEGLSRAMSTDASGGHWWAFSRGRPK